MSFSLSSSYFLGINLEGVNKRPKRICLVFLSFMRILPSSISFLPLKTISLILTLLPLSILMRITALPRVVSGIWIICTLVFKKPLSIKYLFTANWAFFTIVLEIIRPFGNFTLSFSDSCSPFRMPWYVTRNKRGCSLMWSSKKICSPSTLRTSTSTSSNIFWSISFLTAPLMVWPGTFILSPTRSPDIEIMELGSKKRLPVTMMSASTYSLGSA